VVDRQLLTFLGSKHRAKKGKPNKATAKLPDLRCPFGVPVCAGQKMGKRSNRFGLQRTTFSNPFFCPTQTAAPKAEESQKQIPHRKRMMGFA
jgi:hypothetical protein